jgi:hypothetical protein
LQTKVCNLTVWTNKNDQAHSRHYSTSRRSTLVFHSFSIIQIFKIYGVSGWQYRLESMVCIILANKTVVCTFAVKTNKQKLSRCSLSLTDVIVCAWIALTRYVLLFDSRAECKMDTHTVGKSDSVHPAVGIYPGHNPNVRNTFNKNLHKLFKWQNQL